MELCGGRGDADLEAKTLNPALKPPHLNFAIVAEFEESCAGVIVESAVGEQVPRDVQDRVRDRNGGLVGTPSPRNPRILRGEIGVFVP